MAKNNSKNSTRLNQEVEVGEVAYALTGDGGMVDGIILDEKEGRTQHKDIGLIEATEVLDGVQVINRTKHRISPFVPIIKTPNYAENSGNLTGYSVEIEDPDSKTGFRHLGNVSANYLLLTNAEVRSLALEIAHQSGLPFQESRVFWDGARFCHIVDFLETEAVEEGDEVGLSLITRSSYDKSWRYEAALMGKRFACDNGCLSGEFFARVSFKHSAAKSNGTFDPGRREGLSLVEEGWKEIVKQGLSVIEHSGDNLRRFVQGLRLLKGAKMTDERLREVWKLYPEIGDGIMGKIMAHYVQHEEPTLYGLFNAGTNVFYHNPKMTSADFSNNDTFTTGLLTYAFERLN